MQITLPLVLIAIGSVAIVALREGRLLVAALFVQWGGMVLLLLGSMPGARAAWVELVVGLVCLVLLGWSVWTLHNLKIEDVPGLDESHRAGWLLRQERRSWYGRESGLADQALLWVIALAGGVAGFGLARLYPLGGSEEVMLAFYWILLSAVLSLVVHGARDLLKLGVGLLVLLNAIALLVETLALGLLSDVTLGLLGLCRLGLVLTVSYLLVVLKVTFLDADLEDIFDARAGITGDEMALVVVGRDSTNYELQITDYELGEDPPEEGREETGTIEGETEEKGEVPAGG
jgi:hypothetical protein